MTQPVNLNRVRKQRARVDKTKQAAENAVKFGRTKAQKSLQSAQTEKGQRDLDSHKLDQTD